MKGNNIKINYRADANENLFGASPRVTEALQQALHNLHHYPSPDALPLREAIAGKFGVTIEEVLVGSGSAELISLLIRTFCRPVHTSSILSVSPTYPLYQAEAEALGVKYKAVPLDSNYQFDADAILAAADATTRLCFISNPNNPTGSFLAQAQLEKLIYTLPAHVTLVLDEAYAEFATDPNFRSALNYLHQRPNLVILRTFSKAYGLAALRVGYMIAQAALVQEIAQVKQPFNVNHMAQVAAVAALQDEDFLAYTLNETQAGKAHLQQILHKLGIHYWPSEGNFILADAGLKAQQLYDTLQQRGIQVRQTQDPFALRITVGPPEHQLYLERTLEEILTPAALADHQHLAPILEAGKAISVSDEAQAIAIVQGFANADHAAGSSAERAGLAFARALETRLTLNNHYHMGNLYSSSIGETDMISAFSVLIRATPLVTFGHQFANLTIARQVEKAERIHILDLGIGSGLQWLHLFDILATRPEGAPEVSITGIDIPAPGDDYERYLNETRDRLLAYAGARGIRLNYKAIASRLEDVNLLDLSIEPDAVLVVNAAFTLHHIPDQLVSEDNYRDFILRQIKELQPAVFTLTEPSSEHNKLSFMPRLRESLRHYYHVFDALDTLLPPHLPERKTIEQEFFGREIINVVAYEGSERVERHERHEAWQHRLNRTGFTPLQPGEFAPAIASALNLHEHFSLEPNIAGYTLHWKGTPIVASTAWTTNN